MKFSVGQEVMVASGLSWKSARKAVVAKVGRKWAEVGSRRYDADTGIEDSRYTPDRIYSLEDWAVILRNKRAAKALSSVGLETGYSKVPAGAVYDAVKALYGLPNDPPEED